MLFETTYCTYAETGYFSRLVVDYLSGEKSLEPFYAFMPDIDGVNQAIAKRSEFPVDRKLLVKELRNAYADLPVSDLVSRNIESLLEENTFTICTAHQPNIFTGHLYFIYKIIHAIKLSRELNTSMPDKHFVPIYYMGSEDADLNELGSVSVMGSVYTWKTNQKGAVGRMRVDEEFIEIIDAISKEYSGLPFANEVIDLLKRNYPMGRTVEQCTIHLLNEMFGKYGLLVFMPDNPLYKNECKSLIRDELLNGFSQKLLHQTLQEFPADYPLQTKGREINLFYLKGNIRERIEKVEAGFEVVNTDIKFSHDQMISELEDYPERFSPNVVLRPLFQEKWLPNVTFVGGGGELAYWLELKRIFQHANVFYPVLLLRNSFAVADKETSLMINELALESQQLFLPEDELAELLIRKISDNEIDLDHQQIQLKNLYDEIGMAAEKIDPTLQQHVNALHHKASKRLYYLQKKMLKAEKTKHQVMLLKLKTIKMHLFPGDSLQERVNNYFDYHAKYGTTFLEELLQHSKATDSFFCFLSQK